MLLTNYPFSPGTRWWSVIGRVRVERYICIYKGRNCIHKNRTLTEPRVSNSRVYKHISGNKQGMDGWVHIRLCTRGKKERWGGEGITRAGKRGNWRGGEKRGKKEARETFSVASSISSRSLSPSLLRVQTIFIGTRPWI